MHFRWLKRRLRRPHLKQWNRLRPRSRLLLLLAVFSFIFILITWRGSPKQYDQYPVAAHGCPIPQLDPYDKAIEHLVKNKGSPPPSINCEASYPRLFKSTLDFKIVPEEGAEKIRQRWGYFSCCYRTLERDAKATIPDDKEVLSSECFPLSFTAPTKIPEAHEFIAIHCKQMTSGSMVPVDIHAFVPPLKLRHRFSSSEGKQVNIKSKPKEETPPNPKLCCNVLKHNPMIGHDQVTMKKGKLNVIIFGLDSMSRMNFHRVMPQSYAFLKGEMDAVEMVGYNKVGDRTFDNLIPMLTSKTPYELSCLSINNSPSDECPLIWKSFSEKGYSTCYSDDRSIFYKNITPSTGFKYQPTDYYLRPLSHWADLNVGAGFQKSQNACFGPRLTLQFLLHYMERYVKRMSESKKNFFQFTWTSALTHDDHTTGALGDVHLLKSLEWLKHSGYLDNTILILVSDHGMRTGELRSTIQGQLEDRLPFMFFVLPESFQLMYPQAYQNLFGNRKRLVTAFDLHETLKDILDLDRESVKKAPEESSPLPRGLSLFRPIQESRTCHMAGIEMNFCSCNFMHPTSLNNSILSKVADAAVSHINSLLKGHPLCAHLRLRSVTLAQDTGSKYSDSQAYIINFGTLPGDGEFEAMVLANRWMPWRGKPIFDEYFTVRGQVVRTNWYGNHSGCVKEAALKPYCHCSDL